MKYNFLLTRTETAVIPVEIEAEDSEAAYELAEEMLNDGVNPPDFESAHVVWAEETVEYN